jgi:hypothetical protein
MITLLAFVILQVQGLKRNKENVLKMSSCLLVNGCALTTIWILEILVEE